MIAYFERFTIDMTKEQALSASHQGSCDSDVQELVNLSTIRRQLAKIMPEQIKAELKDYGAWDEQELNDQEQNKARIIWIAACNIREGN